ELPEIPIRQTALHLDLREHAAARAVQCLRGKIGRDQVHADTAQLHAQFRDQHRDRISFLPCRRSRAPDAQRASAAPATLGHFRENGGAHYLERNRVPEEERLSRSHGVADRLDQLLMRTGAQDYYQLVYGAESIGFRHGRESALEEIFLTRPERQPALGAQQGADVRVIFGSDHDRTGQREARCAEMDGSGRIEHGITDATTLPGIPQTTLVVSSCTITRPPDEATARHPSRPSSPIPVSTTANTPFGIA